MDRRSRISSPFLDEWIHKLVDLSHNTVLLWNNKIWENKILDLISEWFRSSFSLDVLLLSSSESLEWVFFWKSIDFALYKSIIEITEIWWIIYNACKINYSINKCKRKEEEEDPKFVSIWNSLKRIMIILKITREKFVHSCSRDVFWGQTHRLKKENTMFWEYVEFTCSNHRCPINHFITSNASNCGWICMCRPFSFEIQIVLSSFFHSRSFPIPFFPR